MECLLECSLDLKTRLKAGTTCAKSEFNSLNTSPSQTVLFKFLVCYDPLLL